MAEKIRVFKLASEFGIDKKELVAKLADLGWPVSTYMSTLDEEQADKVRAILRREREEDTVEEHIRPTVVRRRTRTGAPVKPQSVRTPKVDQSPREEAAVSSAETARDDAAPATPVAADERAEAAFGAPEVEASSQSDAAAAEPEAAAAAQDGAAPAEREESADSESEQPAAEDAASAQKADAPSASTAESAADPDKRDEDGKGGEQPVIVPLRPASEAPMVKRRIGEGDRGGVARRRKVESRDMTGSAPGRAPRARVVTPQAAIPGRKRRMTPGKKGKKTEITTPKAIKRVIKIEGQVSLQELARRMSVKATELLMKLMSMGMAGININSTLDVDTAKIIAEEFGYEVEDVAMDEDALLAQFRGDEQEEDEAALRPRAPVVTMMGHVDHGKTSLLDYIRKANVASGEAGGITQHVGAYRAKTSIGEIAFIDTPGHAAFTAMRARGASATDIVVVVCAADDGVMPQTLEAIDHAKAAGCPIIVAINKCDLPNADVERTKRMLMEHGLVPEDLGGDTIMVEVSAKTGQGVDQLLEMISLQAEMMDLKANPSKLASGVVLEAYLDKGRGPVANVLVQDGTLHTGDIVVAGAAYGKIRAMTNERGQKVSSAEPSTPVELLGLSAVPAAGDTFDVVGDIKVAEKVAQSRMEKERQSLAAANRPSLDALYAKMQSEERAELKVLVKADVRGTTEAIRDSLLKLSTDKVSVQVISAQVGGITESDVLLASTGGAIIIGFNVRPTGKAKKLAQEQGVEIKIFSVIYDIIDAIKAAMTGLLSPVVEQKVIGTAEIREVFRIPKVGAVAGCYVTEGKVVRNGLARLIRDSVQIWEGHVDSLRRFKDDVKEVAAGYECGIGLKGFNDIKEGDIIEFYLEEEVQPTLE